MITMTEDQNGRLKPSEEKVLLALSVEDFFMKLLVFKERLDKRLEEKRNHERN